VVDAVKAKGGLFLCQLWHVGRASHPGGADVYRCYAMLCFVPYIMLLCCC
jgi:2,4-dienoyl-CoA reductase-like NADH-dependent reductase (Old Yellow Enzyme family)